MTTYYEGPYYQSSDSKYKRIHLKWDRRIPFEQLSRKLMDDFMFTINEFYKKPRKKIISKQLIYYAVLLIQLYNGLRISEAVDAFKQYIITGDTELEVRTRKRKDNHFRLALIPEIIQLNRSILERALDLGFEGKVDNIKEKVVKKWAKDFIKINTHTLRKAWESYMARKTGKHFLISSWQGRKNLNSHLNYLRSEEFKEEIKKYIDLYFK